MSPTIFSCILCGYVIWNHEFPSSESWLKQFRAICSSSTETWLSGVGLYTEPRAGMWIVPSDSTKRWDDIGHLSPARDRLAVMQQNRINDQHGYVFHDACWSLFKQAYLPESVPLDRLYEICKSLPFPLRRTGVSWGNDCGGLVLFDYHGHYPWEDQFNEREADAITCPHARENPFDVPEIYQLLQDTQQILSTENEINYLGSIKEGRDCFIGLPLEILKAISAYLPTTDFLCLRRVSKAFGSILWSQSFWASRFKANGDRGFLFEARMIKGPQDWKLLYQRTTYIHSTPALRNRRRVWNLIQHLTAILHMRLGTSSDILPLYLQQPSLSWRKVAGDLRQEEPTSQRIGFDGGCRLFYKQRICIPDCLSQIAFSRIQLGDVEYIAGMRLLLTTGADICLGYRVIGQELFCDVSKLFGFVVAVGPRGIRALQAITGDGSSSMCSAVQMICRLRSDWQVLDPSQLWKQVLMGIKCQNKTLRDAALWYPQVPSPHLDLNDKYFTGEDPSADTYQSLVWAGFGGPGGMYLQLLTGITVTFLNRIEFHYNTDDIAAECRQLRRHNPTEYDQVMRFPIDGPGGETIESVEVSLEYSSSKHAYSFFKHGKLRSFKITTNRGNYFHFHPPHTSVDPDTLKPMRVAPGTVITGFYGSQHPEFGLISLGVISEQSTKQ